MAAAQAAGNTKVKFRSWTAEAKFELASTMCIGEAAERFVLPPFSASEDDDLTWTIGVKQGDLVRDDDSVVAIKLHFTLGFSSASGRSNVYARRKIEVHQTASEASIKEACAKLGNEYKRKDFKMSARYLYNNVSKSVSSIGMILFRNQPGNHLIIDAKVHVSDKQLDVVNPPVKSKRLAMDYGADESMADSIGRILDSATFSDVTLHVDGKDIPAHRAILAARSDVFRAMLETECLESVSWKVEIGDISYSVVQMMLRYMYTGSLPHDIVEEEKKDESPEEPTSDVDTLWETGSESHVNAKRPKLEVPEAAGAEDGDDSHLVELLVAADKYMVAGLRALCQDRLVARLAAAPSVLKLVDVLRAGHLLDCKPLRQVGLDYLRRNKERVVKDSVWKEFVKESRSVAADALLDAFF